MKRLGFFLVAATALAETRAAAQCTIEQELRVYNSFGQLGASVGLDGDLAFMGAPRDFDAGYATGAVYVFARQGTQWVQEDRLLATVPATEDWLGQSGALSGETLIAGATGADGVQVDAGAAFVFVRSGTTWSEQAQLVAQDGTTDDRFGAGIALSGDTALVGAPAADAPEVDSGAVYVFERQGTLWFEQAKLVASDGEADAFFGGSLALSGDTAIIGARTSDDIGAAYVFVRSGSTWVEQDKLQPSDVVSGDFFGVATIRGDTALVGAPWQDPYGAAYVFARSGTVWSEQAKLTPGPDVFGTLFGGAVALTDGWAVVGARTDNIGLDMGSVYVFRRSATTWTQTDQLRPTGAGEADFFGSAVALDGDRLLLGAPGTQLQSGAAYFFESTVPQPIAYCTPKTNSLGCLPRVEIAGCPSATATSGYVVSGVDVRNQRTGIFLYSFGPRAAIPFSGGLLCAAPPIYRAPPSQSGGSPPPAQDCSGALSIDMNSFALGLLGGNPRPELLVPGANYRGQWWSRDGGDPFGTSLTNALESTVGP